ncbi:DNA internalization-related competence protein ComEC/Rec2 [bacterium]|nr:DNA internalization-related competence protein ComEC/Rec2 [bacterium]
MQARPAVKVLGFFLIGLLAGQYFTFPAPLLILLGTFALILAFTLWYSEKRHDTIKDLSIAAGLILLGFAHYELATGYLPRDHIAHFTNYKDPVAILGTVYKYPEPGTNKLSISVSAKEIFIEGKLYRTQGAILVHIRFPQATSSYGDELIIRGRLRKPRDRRNPGEFDYRAYLLAQGIYGIVSVSYSSQVELISSENGSWILRNVVYPIKSYLEEYLNNHLPDRVSALLKGLLIGQRGEVTPELRDSFAKVGVVHLLAVSGLHVGFIMIIFMGVLGLLRVPYTGRVILTLMALIFYSYLTNLKPPVVRASIMGGLLLGSSVLSRKIDVFNTLAIAALVILIDNPLELSQSGFQLSFGAVISIVYLFPKFRRFIRLRVRKIQKLWFVRYPVDLILVSLAVYLGTLPFTVYYFDRLPNLALLANLVCVPLAFLGLASGIVAAALNLFLPGLALLYLNASFVFLQTLINLVSWASQLPMAYWQIYKFSSVEGLLYFIGLVLLLNMKRPSARRWLILYTLFLANILLWWQIFTRDETLKVVYFDVGQGDAALLTFPDGRHALIDGGPRGMHSDAGEWVIAPYLKREGIDEIDVVVLSHADADHLGGLPYIFRHFRVHEVWDNGQANDTRLYGEYHALIDSLQIERRILKAGDYLADFEPVQIIVVHPSEKFLREDISSINDGSLSLKISYGETDFLFVGDIEERGETRIAQFGDLIDSEVLKVAHHGSATSSSMPVLKAANSRWAIISVGEFNKFGHPDLRVVTRLKRTGSEVLRTDHYGAVILRTDGINIERINWK